MNVTGTFRPSKCKRHLDIVLGKMLQPNSSSELDRSLPYIRAANVQWGCIDWTDLKKMWFSPADRRKYTLEDGDLVVLEGGDVGRSALVRGFKTGFGFQNSIHRVRANKDTEIRFVYYWMAHLKSSGYLDLICSKATLAHFTSEKFAETPFPAVGLATQRQIADFLDRETARIDLLIEKKQRLVALLGKKWESVVEEAITTGGKRTRLGHHIDILSGYAFPSSDFSTNCEDIPLLRGANVSPGSIRWDDTVYWPGERLNEVSRFLLEPGDVVLGMDRPWISTGIRLAELAEHDAPALLLQRVCRIEPRNTLDKQFMKLLLTSSQFLAYFEPIMTGVSVPHISPDQVGSFRFEYVERDLQASRATTAIEERDRIVQVRSKTEESIDRLKEYRAALITAAVTGQIEVNTAAKAGTSDRQLDTIQEEMEA